MSKRRLCLSSMLVLLLVALFAAFLPFISTSVAKADEPVVYSDDVTIDFSESGLSIAGVAYSSNNVALRNEVDLGNGKYTCLTTAMGNSKGYVIFYFKAPEGKSFATLDLEFFARLFDYNNFGTNECVNFYVGSNVKDLDACELAYESYISTTSSGQTVNLDLDRFVSGKTEFFVKLEVGNSSANTDWCAVKSVSFDVSYFDTSVTYYLVDDYGTKLEVIENVEQGSLVGLDVSSYREFERTDLAVYKDAACKEAVAEGEKVKANAEYYIKGIWGRYSITYELNGGVNNAKNPSEYIFSQGVTLEDAGKTGYAFVGWFEDEALTKPVYDISAGTKGNIKVYAKFVKNQVPQLDVSVKDTNAGDAEGCSSFVGNGTAAMTITLIAVAGLFLSIRTIKRKSK